MQFSRRMDNLAPYLFAEMERKISEKRKSGVDVISLGIGDPDLPTPAYIVEEMQRQVADAANHRYPSNWGLPEFGEAAASFYKRRFGVDLDPAKEFFPLLGAKEGLAHICWALLDAGDLALVPDPGYPGLCGRLDHRGSGGPLSESAVRRRAFSPISTRSARKRPGGPRCCSSATRTIPPPRWSRTTSSSGWWPSPRSTTSPWSTTTRTPSSPTTATSPRASSACPGAKDVGVEFFSFSKPFNMTGWRIGFAVGNHEILAHLWRLKTNMDSGMFDALQRTAAFILNGPWDFVHEMCEIYRRRRDLLAEALVSVGMQVPKPKGTIYMWIPVPAGYTSASFSEHVLEQAGVVVTPGRGYGPAGEGFVRLSLTTPDDRIAEAVARIERSLRL